MAVEGEAPGGVGLLGEVSHSPAAGIGTTGDKELAIYSLVTKDSQKLQLAVGCEWLTSGWRKRGRCPLRQSGLALPCPSSLWLCGWQTTEHYCQFQTWTTCLQSARDTTDKKLLTCVCGGGNRSPAISQTFRERKKYKDLSYLFQIKVLHRHDLSAHSQHAQHGSQHLQQYVPHGSSSHWWASPAGWGDTASQSSFYPAPTTPPLFVSSSLPST